MIEINLPTEAAITLLKDQVLLEFKRQKKLSAYAPLMTVDELSEKEFKRITEIALFDILALLPVTLVTEESNLPTIISKSVTGLAYKYSKRNLLNYGENEAKKLLFLLKKSFGDFSGTTTYQNN